MADQQQCKATFDISWCSVHHADFPQGSTMCAAVGLSAAEQRAVQDTCINCGGTLFDHTVEGSYRARVCANGTTEYIPAEDREQAPGGYNSTVGTADPGADRLQAHVEQYAESLLTRGMAENIVDAMAAARADMAAGVDRIAEFDQLHDEEFGAANNPYYEQPV